MLVASILGFLPSFTNLCKSLPLNVVILYSNLLIRMLEYEIDLQSIQSY